MTMLDKHHDALLRRGRRLWDLASLTYYGLLERLGPPLWDLAVKHLELRAGQAVLDIGCGTGATVQALRDAVGPDGRVVAVDYSPRMIAQVRKRVRHHGWTNVEIRQADASRTPQGHAEFDAAVALGSFSAMPDVRAAIDNAHDALRPGGRLFVFDMRLAGTTTTTKFLRRAYRALAGFTGADVVAELRRAFATVEPVFPAAGDGTTTTIVLATKTTDRSALPPAPTVRRTAPA